MSSEIPPWNILQFIIICTFTCFYSFFGIPSGGLSVIAYFLCLLVIGIPAVFVQLKVGGYLQKGIVGVLSMFFPIWKGAGIMALLDLLLMISTFAPMAAQLGTYAFIAISNHPYTWGSCEFLKFSISDSVNCVDSVDTLTENTDVAGREPHLSEELFYKYEFLQLSHSVENVEGFPQWKFADLARKAEISMMPVTLAIVWVLVSLFVGFGPRICGWILFLLGPAGLCCLLTVLGYGYHNLDTDKAKDFLRMHYLINDKRTECCWLQEWILGFKLLTYSFPMWTGICCTMGKLCGRSRKVRNLTWVMLLAVFVLVSQAPTLAMAPYLGNLMDKYPSLINNFQDVGRLMWQMPAAFSALEIPQPYAFIFFLSAFLFSLMFLCIGTLVIVDNMMDALRGWIDRQACSKIAVHLLLTFLVMVVCQGIGFIQTTHAGHYYFLLFTQSMDKLRFAVIIILAFGVLVVYVRQNFGLVERVLMGIWFTLAAIGSAAIWLYWLYEEIYVNDGRVQYDSLTKKRPFPEDWTWVSWVLAAFPFLGIILGIIHASFVACKNSNNKCSKLCCGVTERVREHNGDEFTPPLLPPSEPSAPPYMYSYMDSSYNGTTGAGGSYPMDHHYKLDHSPTELEPLTYGDMEHMDRGTRI